MKPFAQLLRNFRNDTDVFRPDESLFVSWPSVGDVPCAGYLATRVWNTVARDSIFAPRDASRDISKKLFGLFTGV